MSKLLLETNIAIAAQAATAATIQGVLDGVFFFDDLLPEGEDLK
jgi:hypothetical protein